MAAIEAAESFELTPGNARRSCVKARCTVSRSNTTRSAKPRPSAWRSELARLTRRWQRPGANPGRRIPMLRIS